MDPVTWSRLRPLIEEALERPAVEREEFVRGRCGADEVLAGQALELLAADSSGGLLEGDAAPLAALGSSAPRPGLRLGPWRLERELGRGGMGSVWLAARDDEAFDKRVAIKLVRPELAGPELLQRFRREQRVLASLEHPGIARLIDVGSDDAGRPYLVMEWVEGLPIDRWCAERELGLRARVELVRRVAAAVGHAHQRLVVHRDLKPANVLVDGSGAPRLLDFGIARLLEESRDAQSEHTATGELRFTPQYASPEQVRGEWVGTQSDVYSLGVLLYELLSGRRPYELAGASPTEVLRVVGESDPPMPSAVAGDTDSTRRWRRDLQGDLDAIVMCALRKETARRYASIEALDEDLRRWLEGLPVRARPDSLGYRTAKFLRRHGVSVGAAAALFLALSAGLVGTTHQYLQARDAREAEATQKELALARATELERLSEDLRLQRGLAEERFAEVRRFATALIFDVERSLSPLPGATQAREQVVRLGLEHLEQLSRQADDDELRSELAGAWVRMGSVLGGVVEANLGQGADAEQCFRRALELARAVEGPAPRVAGLPLVSEAGYRLVDGLLFSGRDAEARAELERLQADLEPLVAGPNPQDADMVALLSIGDRRMRMAMDAGELELAEALLERQLEWSALLQERHPGSPAALQTRASVLTTAWRVDSLRRRDELATQRLEQALELLEAARAAEPRHPRLAHDLVVLQCLLAECWARRGDLDDAVWLLAEAVEHARESAALDAADSLARQDLGQARGRLGRLLLKQGEDLAALEELEPALELVLEASRSAPERVDLVEQVAFVYLGLTNARRNVARAPEALAALERAFEWIRRALELAPEAPQRRRAARAHLLELAELALEFEELDEPYRSAALARGVEAVTLGLELAPGSASSTELDGQLDAGLRALGTALETRAGTD